jgi:hypothetical protein
MIYLLKKSTFVVKKLKKKSEGQKNIFAFPEKESTLPLRLVLYFFVNLH